MANRLLTRDAFGVKEYRIRILAPWKGVYYSISTDEWCKGRKLLFFVWCINFGQFHLRIGVGCKFDSVTLYG